MRRLVTFSLDLKDKQKDKKNNNNCLFTNVRHSFIIMCNRNIYYESMYIFISIVRGSVIAFSIIDP